MTTSNPILSKLPDLPVLKTYLKPLPVRLDQREMLERGTRLAQIEDELSAMTIDHDARKREMKTQRSVLENSRAAIAGVVRRGEESRDVRVNVYADYDRKVAVEFRLDTGVRTTERALTDEELQGKLFREQLHASEAPATAACADDAVETPAKKPRPRGFPKNGRGNK